LPGRREQPPTGRFDGESPSPGMRSAEKGCTAARGRDLGGGARLTAPLAAPPPAAARCSQVECVGRAWAVRLTRCACAGGRELGLRYKYN